MIALLITVQFVLLIWLGLAVRSRITELSTTVAAQQQRITVLEIKSASATVRASEPTEAPATPSPTMSVPAATTAPQVAFIPPWKKDTTVIPPITIPERPPSFSDKFLSGRKVEDVIGENLLALVGGLFVIIGAIFFLTMAVRNGWIDEAGRTVLVLGGGAVLLAVGLWLAERRGGRSAVRRGQLAVGSLHGVVAGTGVMVMFLGALVGTRLYDVIPAGPGLLLALGIGAVATAVAVRWESQDLAAFGIVGALGSPVLVDAPPTTFTLAFISIALISSVIVVVREGWPWLLSATFLITAPQVAAWAHDFVPAGGTLGQVGIASIVLVAYWAVVLTGALARELRDPVLKLRTSSASVVFALAGVIALMAQDILNQAELVGQYRPLWLLGFAVLHLAVGGAVLAFRRSSQAIAVFVIGIGSALLAAGAADLLSGSPVVAWWVAEAVALSWLYWFTRDLRAGVLSISFGTLAAFHALTLDAPPNLLLRSPESLTASLVALTSLIAGSALAWKLAPQAESLGRVVRRATSYVGLVFVGYLLSILVVAGFSRSEVAHANGVVYDVDAQFALAILWSVLGLGIAALGSKLSRRELSGTGAALACFAPLYLAILGNSRGLEAVVWLTMVAIAGGLVARRLTAEYPLAIGTWFAASAALHVLTIESPLLKTLSVGSETLPTAVAGVGFVLVGISLLRALVGVEALARGAEVRVVMASLEVGVGVLVTFLMSIVVVTVSTPAAVRAAAQGNGFAGTTDDLAQLLLNGVWVGMTLGIGYLAVRRAAPHLVWLASGLAMLVLVKTLAVGPADSVLGSVMIAVQGIILAWLALNCRPAHRMGCVISGYATAGLLTGMTLVNVPPSSLLYGVDAVRTDTMLVSCLGLLFGGAALVGIRKSVSNSAVSQFVTVCVGFAAASVVYALSVLTVGMLTSNQGVIEQDAQTALSILWGVLGVSALAHAALRHGSQVRAVRIGGFVLLGMAAAKVLVFDTSQLEATYRVLVFIGLGLLLLGGAYLDQRLSRSDGQ